MTLHEGQPHPHRVGSLTFDAPSRWGDTTVFSFQGEGDPAPIITVRRERMLPGDHFRAHVARKLVWLGKNVPGFDLLDSGEIAPVGGRAAHQLRFSFEPPEASLRFEQTMVLVDADADPARVITVFSTSAAATDLTGPRPTAAEITFDGVGRSARFDDARAPVPQARASTPQLAVTPPPPPPPADDEYMPMDMVPMPGARTSSPPPPFQPPRTRTR